MEYIKIEELRNYYIEKYGMPSEQKFGDITYKTINRDLEAFNDLINSLFKLVDKVGLTNIEKQINLICEYCKHEQPDNLDRITDKLNAITKELDKKVNFSKTKFVNLMKELEILAENPKFNPNLVSNYFKYHLNVKFIEFNIKTNRRTIDRTGDSFWGRNKGLEDNNI